MRDIAPNIGLTQAVAPAVQSATETSPAIDLLGFGSAAAVVSTGAVAGSGDFTAKLQESDTTTSGDFKDVDASHLVGAFPATLDAESVFKVGYIGTSRYLRVVLTKNSGTSIAASVTIVKGHPAEAPVA